MILLQSSGQLVAEMVDGVKYEFPSGEAVEVKNDFYAEAILRHLWWSGIVQVDSVRDRSGVHYDMDAAIAASKAACQDADKQLVQQYLNDQKLNQQAGRPLQEPTGNHEAAIHRQHGDVKAFIKGAGVVIAGYNGDTGTQVRDAEFEAMKKQNAELSAKMDKLLASLGEPTNKGKAT